MLLVYIVLFTSSFLKLSYIQRKNSRGKLLLPRRPNVLSNLRLISLVLLRLVSISNIWLLLLLNILASLYKLTKLFNLVREVY